MWIFFTSHDHDHFLSHVKMNLRIIPKVVAYKNIPLKSAKLLHSVALIIISGCFALCISCIAILYVIQADLCFKSNQAQPFRGSPAA